MKQTARSGKLNNMQGTAPRLSTKNRPHQTPCRTATACPPTKPLRGICCLTLEGRFQVPNGAPLTLLLAVGPRQTAGPICRRPPPHRRLRPAASSTGRYVANCFNQPWFECGSLRSTGWASAVVGVGFFLCSAASARFPTVLFATIDDGAVSILLLRSVQAMARCKSSRNGGGPGR